LKAIVWITGVAGFTGRHLVAHLRGLPDQPRIIGIDHAEGNYGEVDSYHRIDLSETDELADLARTEHPSWVIHLAGAMPPANEEQMWKINAGCTVSILRALSFAGCNTTRVLSIGSAAEYLPQRSALTEDSPCGGASLYGAIKWAQSLLALNIGRSLGIPTMVARPFNLIGSGLPTNLVLGWLCYQFSNPGKLEEIVIGNLESARDFVDIRDAVAAYWLVVTRGAPGDIYNVCTEKLTSIRQLIDMLCHITGKNPLIRVDPSRLKSSDPSVCYGSYSKLEQATGWRPRIKLKDSLTEIVREKISVIARSTEKSA